MTAPAGGAGPGGPRADGPGVWRQVQDPSTAFPCTHAHGPASGALDETARRLSHEEYAVARLLAGEGHDVRSLAESRRGGRCSDLLVCGTPVEVKSFMPRAERRREPTPQSVLNKLLDAGGQASHVVLVGTGSGLSPSTARRGLARYSVGDRAVPRLASVRVVGDGYDLAWRRHPGIDLRPRFDRLPGRGRAEPELGM